jgi:DNA polymerase-3 subunit delta
MDFETIVGRIKKKQFDPVYFLTGEEPFFIDKISHMIEDEVLTDDEKSFNLMVLYGIETTDDQVLSQARQYPTMASHRVVIVREAQNMRRLADSASLLAYLQKPVPTTILVFDYKYKKIDGRTELGKMLKSKTVYFQSKQLYDKDVPGFIRKQITSRGFMVSDAVVQLLAANLGTNLSKIENEIGKLVLNQNVGAEITVENVEQNIGISKDYNIFALQDALGKRDFPRAISIADYFGNNTKEFPAIFVLVMLFAYFRKVFHYHFLKDKSKANAASQLSVPPFTIQGYEQASKNYNPPQVRRILGLLRQYDQLAKGVDSAPIEDGELLRELVYKVVTIR